MSLQGDGDDEEDEDEDSAPASGAPSGRENAARTRQPQSAGGRSGSDTPMLDKYGYDMTQAAEDNRLDPVVGRDVEIERLAQILSRRKKTIRCSSVSREWASRPLSRGSLSASCAARCRAYF